MEIPNHSLPQITPEVLEKLKPDELLNLSVKLLKDLKELHDRLNQNSKNSSRPPSSAPACEKNNNSNTNAHKTAENGDKGLEESKPEEQNKENNQNDSNSNDLNTNIKTHKSISRTTEKLTPKKPGETKRRHWFWSHLGSRSNRRRHPLCIRNLHCM
jgi:hypothetical protein